MIDSKRARLQRVPHASKISNASLILNRYLEHCDDDNASRSELYKAVAGSTPPGIYREAFERWQATLAAMSGVSQREFQTVSRLAVGRGQASVLESGLALSSLYGAPIIPGSALKGLTAAYARQNQIDEQTRQSNAQAPGLTPDEMEVLFGSVDSAAFVTYFDAWFVPGASAEGPFKRSVITTHHPDYYSSQGQKRWPWDFDDPVPIHQLEIEGTFLVAVRCPESTEWAELAMAMLEGALAQWGIGAKTSSGYGRFRANNPDTKLLLDEIRKQPVDENWLPLYNKYIDRLKALPLEDRSAPAEALLALLKKAGLPNPQGDIRTRKVLAWVDKKS